jgi:pimeloyl-ACP methyl ester carboxylesterase
MSGRRVIFIPDRFADCRIWADIPDRLAGQTEVIHLDQHATLPWTGGDGAVVAAAASDPLLAGGGDVVAAIGEGCRLAVELAAARLAAGLVLFDPTVPFDRIPDDLRLSDFAPIPDIGDLENALAPYEPLAAAMTDADPDRWRDMLVQVVRQTTAATAGPTEQELAAAMAADHAEEMRAAMLAFAAVDETERELTLDIQLEHLHAQGRWLDELASLTAPVMIVVSAPGRYYAEAIARIAAHVEIVVTDGGAGLAPPASRARSADAILRMLERVG